LFFEDEIVIDVSPSPSMMEPQHISCKKQKSNFCHVFVVSHFISFSLLFKALCTIQ
jgi:hypothetical protein